MRGVALALLLAAQLPPGSPLPLGAGPEIHGERDVFSNRDVVIVWAVLNAPVEEDTQVVIRVELGDGPYRYVRLYGIDPFSGDRRLMGPLGRVPDPKHVPGLLPRPTETLRTPRNTFAGHPRREIRLYRTFREWEADVPALTIYYLGVPDTAPEFVSEIALAEYLANAVSRARPR